ncbi:MAG: DUF6916 family protein [Rhizomicrobium sp.]
MDMLKTADFAPLAGKPAHLKGTPFTLTLDRVEGGDGPPPPGYQRAPFIVIFRGAKGEVVPNGMYDCVFEGGPVINLHLMPIHTASPDRQEYQSVFS